MNYQAKNHKYQLLDLKFISPLKKLISDAYLEEKLNTEPLSYIIDHLIKN